MRTNVGDKKLREKGKLLIIGSCMHERFPESVSEFSEKNGGYAVLHVCLEEMHVNQVGFKIASMVRYAQLSSVTVLTVDGSPHCVQLHYVIEDIRKHFTSEINTHHYVVEKGTVSEISPEAVKRSRHLSKIQKMIDRE
ncbi:MAG: 4Fe-4S ferredoxin [Candidatus Thorarchaeota archaeon]|nr:4Fe-4S ferredoxin [Candidatus Thorarchaeota archaeon]